MLGKCEEISWININKIGTTALVRIIERKDMPEVIMPALGYANIVADRDCVIEEITVSAGIPTVKVGDTVKKGEVLILGVENNERGKLIRADGYIVGRVEDKITTVLMRDREVKTRLSEETVSVNIKIFNFSLNIFKKYGNSDKECDIIEGKRRVVLFGKYKLPITFEVKSRVSYGKKIESYTDAELAKVCSVRHRQLVKQRLLDKDLTKIKTESSFDGDSYGITSSVIYSARVGVLSEVLVE
jgi:similar to stage IV sporulation protein